MKERDMQTKTITMKLSDILGQDVTERIGPLTCKCADLIQEAKIPAHDALAVAFMLVGMVLHGISPELEEHYRPTFQALLTQLLIGELGLTGASVKDGQHRSKF
jgi:hypothetical protein